MYVRIKNPWIVLHVSVLLSEQLMMMLLESRIDFSRDICADQLLILFITKFK